VAVQESPEDIVNLLAIELHPMAGAFDPFVAPRWARISAMKPSGTNEYVTGPKLPQETLC
jgi:hypothetical protein